MIDELIHYDMPVFRPPSEADSLILQVTLGCSWNRCIFCEMYTEKSFTVRKTADIFADISKIAPYSARVKRIFLADGNVMALSTARLVLILEEINRIFPSLTRISAYALPRDILAKSSEELRQIRKLGLQLIYVGIESGDDQVLALMNKGETARSTVNGLVKAREAGIKTSVMILTGLGGKELSRRHALASAQVVNEIQPEFLSTLVLMFPYGLAHFQNRIAVPFTPLEQKEILEEMKMFIENCRLQRTVYRSDHASNYLPLKGVLDKDKGTIVKEIDHACQNISSARLRPEWSRGL